MEEIFQVLSKSFPIQRLNDLDRGRYPIGTFVLTYYTTFVYIHKSKHEGLIEFDFKYAFLSRNIVVTKGTILNTGITEFMINQLALTNQICFELFNQKLKEIQ